MAAVCPPGLQRWRLSLAYDGSDYDTIVQLGPNSTTLLLVYGNSRSAYSSEVLGTYISVERSKG